MVEDVQTYNVCKILSSSYSLPLLAIIYPLYSAVSLRQLSYFCYRSVKIEGVGEGR